MYIWLRFENQSEKNKQIDIGIPGHYNCLFIRVLEGNLQWNNWCCEVINYLKAPIVKFKVEFEKALEHKRELI